MDIGIKLLPCYTVGCGCTMCLCIAGHIHCSCSTVVALLCISLSELGSFNRYMPLCIQRFTCLYYTCAHIHVYTLLIMYAHWQNVVCVILTHGAPWYTHTHTHTHTHKHKLFIEIVSVQKYSSEALGYGVHRPHSSPLSPCLQREPLNYTHTH